MTPTQQGQFLRPGAPVSRVPPTYRASPFSSGASPKVMIPPVHAASSRRYSAAQDDDDEWERATNAWGSSSQANKGGTPRGDGTPRG